MLKYLRLAEARGSLGAIADQAMLIGPFSLIQALHHAVSELGTVSKKLLLPIPKNKKAQVVIDVPVIEVRREPAPLPVLEEDEERLPARRIPATTSYNSDRYLPYRVLWAKVIIRATYDYALWRDSKDIRLRKFAQDAERWIFESSDLEFSFENICFAFNFPVENIRRRTRALTKQDVKKLEFRERQGKQEVLPGTTDGNRR